MNVTNLLVECAGWIGAGCVLIAYYLISTNKIDTGKPIYHWLNIFGAFGLILHTVYNAAYPSAFVNIIWIGVAIYSLKKGRI